LIYYNVLTILTILTIEREEKKKKIRQRERERERERERNSKCSSLSHDSAKNFAYKMQFVSRL